MTSKLGFSAEYVESISPAERDMYIKYYLKEQEEERKSRDTQSSPVIGSPIGE